MRTQYESTLIKPYRIYLFTSANTSNKYLYYALIIIEYARLSAMAVLQSRAYSISVINSARASTASLKLAYSLYARALCPAQKTVYFTLG